MPSTIRKLFSCCEEVGPFNKIYKKETNIGLKIFWTVIVLILLFCFTVHFYFEIARFLEYHKVTDAKIADNGFEFPDVTICPTQPFDTSEFNKLKIQDTYKSFFEAWKSIIGQDASFRRNREIWEATQHSLGMILPSQRPSLFRSVKSQLVYCQYNGYLCDHRNFTVYPVPGRKNCFSFKTSQRKLKRPGQNEGLYLILNANNSTAYLTPTEKLSKQVGYFVDLHTKETRPQFTTASFLATENEQTNVEVSMTEINDISTPIDRCQTDKRSINVVHDFAADPWKSNNFSQVLGDCRESELQLQLEMNCFCNDETLIILDNKKTPRLCHEIPKTFWKNLDFNASRLTIQERTDLKKRAECFIKENDRFRDFSLDISRCYNPCKRVIYTKSVTINKLAETDVINDALEGIILEKGSSDVSTPYLPNKNEKLVSIKVFPPTLNSMKYDKKVEFDWVELISEGGGIIGLWVGWCILTFFEMIAACFAGRLCPENENNNEDRKKEPDECIPMYA